MLRTTQLSKGHLWSVTVTCLGEEGDTRLGMERQVRCSVRNSMPALSGFEIFWEGDEFSLGNLVAARFSTRNLGQISIHLLARCLDRAARPIHLKWFRPPCRAPGVVAIFSLSTI